MRPQCRASIGANATHSRVPPQHHTHLRLRCFCNGAAHRTRRNRTSQRQQQPAHPLRGQPPVLARPLLDLLPPRAKPLARGDDNRPGGVARPTARRPVLMSNRSRRALSFFATPSTRHRWRISAHWLILITSVSSWPRRRDGGVSPRRSSPGRRRFRVLSLPLPGILTFDDSDPQLLMLLPFLLLPSPSLYVRLTLPHARMLRSRNSNYTIPITHNLVPPLSTMLAAFAH